MVIAPQAIWEAHTMAAAICNSTRASAIRRIIKATVGTTLVATRIMVEAINAPATKTAAGEVSNPTSTKRLIFQPLFLLSDR
jgi:hypothetical protein